MPNGELRGSRFELRYVEGKDVSDQHALNIVEEGRFGFLHSEETGSAVDGPGLRVVFWTTGCEFRCLYCHNPDSWKLKHGQLVCVDDLLAELKKYQHFLQIAGGGVTVSGGEPLVQDRFVVSLLRGAKELGIHTALDTNGYLGHKLSDEELELVDLVLFDLKSFLPDLHLRLTSKPVEGVLKFAQRLSQQQRPMWLRFVLVPGLTDVKENIEGVARFAASLSNVLRVEVLPFHQLGRFKWRELGMRYELDQTRVPTPEELAHVQSIFRAYGVHCPM